MSFGPVLVGSEHKESVSLINSEDIPYAYTIHLEDIDNEDNKSRQLNINDIVEIHPASGVIGMQ